MIVFKEDVAKKSFKIKVQDVYKLKLNLDLTSNTYFWTKYEHCLAFIYKSNNNYGIKPRVTMLPAT